MRECHHEQLIWQGVPRLQRGALSPTGSRPVVLRASFDRPRKRAKNKKDVLVILYSWPSDGSALPFVAYGSDRTDAIGSGFALGRAFLKLRNFLTEATQTMTPKGAEEKESTQPCEQTFNLLCHSMGNYVLQNALQRMVERTAGRRLARIFDHIFLCAPDVDDDVLEPDQPLGRLHELCRNVNIYFNRGDLALRGSDYTKGNPDRLGTNGVANPHQVHKKVYQMDCSGDLVKGVLEHSYYQNGSINADIRMSLDDLSQEDPGRFRKVPDRYPNTYTMIRKKSK